MCDHQKTFNQLKDRQVKIEPVRCTCSTKCWCNELSFRFPVDQGWDECMSPKEMLEQHGEQMDEDDVKFLTSFLHREFIS